MIVNESPSGSIRIGGRVGDRLTQVLPQTAQGMVAALLAALALCGCGARPDAGRTVPRAAETTGITTSVQSPLRSREPAVAGLFYPAERTALAQAVDVLLKGAPEHFVPRLRGLVCPHAGYEFSGKTAAAGYKLLAGREIQTVILLAASHYAAFGGVSVADVDAYQTPLGSVMVWEVAKELAREKPFVLEPKCLVQRPPWWQQGPKAAPPAGGDTPETWEHAVEVQLPFLQQTVKDFKILPVMFGQAEPAEVARKLAGRIDDRTLIVASSDLSHYHPWGEARELDAECVKAICNLDVDRMRGQEACGKLAILTLMCLAREKGWKTQLLDNRNSGDVTGDKGRVVGYASVAFYAPAPETYNAAERDRMLKLARRTLVKAATKGSPLEDIEENPFQSLAEKKGCFVTLTEGGTLRGCIGHILPQEPLHRAVVANAWNAACRDPRFDPVRPEEVDKIRIEISVLTVPEPVRFNSPEELLPQLQPYEDGVVLQVGERGATFLPQVWSQIPDKVEFLNQLSRKAGCEPSAWRGKETAVSLYHVESFEEPPPVAP